jgi:hypothetical protein
MGQRATVQRATRVQRQVAPHASLISAQTIAVVNASAALAHHRALIGEIPAGLFPRDLNVDPGTGQVLADSNTVEMFRQPPPP